MFFRWIKAMLVIVCSFFLQRLFAKESIENEQVHSTKKVSIDFLKTWNIEKKQKCFISICFILVACMVMNAKLYLEKQTKKKTWLKFGYCKVK